MLPNAGQRCSAATGQRRPRQIDATFAPSRPATVPRAPPVQPAVRPWRKVMALRAGSSSLNNCRRQDQEQQPVEPGGRPGSERVAGRVAYRHASWRAPPREAPLLNLWSVHADAGQAAAARTHALCNSPRRLSMAISTAIPMDKPALGSPLARRRHHCPAQLALHWSLN